MKKSIKFMVIPLFLCVVLFLIVISCFPSSSVRALTPANSTFGFYFGSPTATNASSPRAVTPANSTFGFYFESPILLHSTLSNVTHVATLNKTSTIASHIGKTSTNNVGQISTVNSRWSIIPSLYHVYQVAAPKTNMTAAASPETRINPK
jgi:hypothetical protein